MNLEQSQVKNNRRMIKVFSWILILLLPVLLIKILTFPDNFIRMVKFHLATRNFIPPIQFDFTLYFFKCGIEFLLCLFVFVSASLCFNLEINGEKD